MKRNLQSARRIVLIFKPTRAIVLCVGWEWPGRNKGKTQMNITYGTFNIEVESLPAKSLEAMIQRGVSHYMGNEVAAKVAAWTNKLAEEKDGTPGHEASDDEKTAKKEEIQADFYNRLLTGDIGTAIRGPQVTPFDKAAQAEARARVSARLKANGLKVPKGDETIKLGDGAFTIQALIDRCIARELEDAFVINAVTFEPIRKVADRVVKDSQKRADAAAKAKAEGAKDAESVGL